MPFAKGLMESHQDISLHGGSFFHLIVLKRVHYLCSRAWVSLFYVKYMLYCFIMNVTSTFNLYPILVLGIGKHWYPIHSPANTRVITSFIR